MRLARGRLSIGVLVVAALAWPSAGMLRAAPPRYTAAVTPHIARFVFPLADRQWEWSGPDTRSAALEYRITAEVENGGATYEVGFMLFKLQNSGRGDTRALLKAGQVNVFQRNESGAAAVRGLRARANGASDHIEVIVYDEETVRRLFSSRPSHVILHVELPGTASVQERVAVAYE
jgi:hypothetical protein